MCQAGSLVSSWYALTQPSATSRGRVSVQWQVRIINSLESEVCKRSHNGGKNGTLRQGSTETRQERYAPAKERHASLRPEWERGPSEKPETGYCHRPFRGTQKGSKGTAKALQLIVIADS